MSMLLMSAIKGAFRALLPLFRMIPGESAQGCEKNKRGLFFAESNPPIVKIGLGPNIRREKPLVRKRC